jgi:hypothetical protein
MSPVTSVTLPTPPLYTPCPNARCWAGSRPRVYLRPGYIEQGPKHVRFGYHDGTTASGYFGVVHHPIASGWDWRWHLHARSFYDTERGHSATGVARTRADAEHAVWAIAGAEELDVLRNWQSLVTSVFAEMARTKRMARPPRCDAAGPSAIEFAWVRFWSGDGDSIYAHQILKKTARFVFVDSESFNQRTSHRAWCVEQGRSDSDDYILNGRKTWRLDRAKFEQNEGVLVGRAWWQPIYARPPERADYARVFDAELAALELSWPCEAHDVERAYRAIVKRAHPDAGGTADWFMRVRRAYAILRGALKPRRAEPVPA